MTSRPMDLTFGGPSGEEQGGKVSPYQLPIWRCDAESYFGNSMKPS